MNYIKLGSIILVIFFLGCSGKDLKDHGLTKVTINNDFKHIDEWCDLSKYLDFQVIPLKSETFKSYISESVGIFTVIDSLIIIFDDTALGKVAAFDINGNFVWEKTASTEAYDLFSSIGNVEFYADRFEIYDTPSGKFFYYDYAGNFLGTSYSEIEFSDKKHLGNGIFAFNTYLNANYHLFNDESVAYSLLFVDSTGIIDRALPYPPRYDNIQGIFRTSCGFMKFHDNYFYHPVFSDTVYTISGTKVSPTYIIEFEKNKMEADFLDKYERHGFKYLKEGNGSLLYNTIDAGEIIMSKYNHASAGWIFSVIEKETNYSLCNASWIVIDYKALPIPAIYNDGRFVNLISRYNYELMNKYYDYKQNKITGKDLQDAIEAMGEETDEENPLLILYTIKE